MSLFLALTALTVVAASLVLDWWYFSWLRSKRLPPGPAPWPIIGSILQRRTPLSDFPTLARELQAKYGRITTFWIGRTPVIFVNDPALTNDALVKQGLFFANRTKRRSEGLSSCGFRTLNTSEGPWTNALRKNVMTYMLGPAKLRAFKYVRDAAYEGIISGVKSATKDGVAEVSVSSIVRYHLMKSGVVLVFGVELEDDLVQEINLLMTLRTQQVFRFRLGDYIRAYRTFDREGIQVINDNQKTSEAVLGPIIDRVRTLQGDKSVIGGNYCQTLFRLEEQFPEHVTSKSVKVCLCCEFLNASVQTTTDSVGKAMTALSEHPEIQTKLFQEIEATVGKRPVDESDLPDLPYLSAVVKESLRRYGPGRSTLPHATSEMRMLGGYEIPTDACIYFTMEAFHFDPSRWSDPLAFKPERFVEDDLDVLGTRDFSFLPFGAGRRFCPGYQVAVLELSVIVARMVQAFEWQKPSTAKIVGTGPGIFSFGGIGSDLCARPRSV